MRLSCVYSMETIKILSEIVYRKIILKENLSQKPESINKLDLVIH